jgi:hypothetical protein
MSVEGPTTVEEVVEVGAGSGVGVEVAVVDVGSDSGVGVEVGVEEVG